MIVVSCSSISVVVAAGCPGELESPAARSRVRRERAAVAAGSFLFALFAILRTPIRRQFH